VRARSIPGPAAVRSEWSKRNDNIRFKFLPLSLRDMSLDPEASPAELSAYYSSHPDQFQRKARLRFRYLRFALPPSSDPARARAERDTLARARRLAEALERGISV